MTTEYFFGNTINVGSLLEQKRECMDSFIKEDGCCYSEMKHFMELTKDRKTLLDIGCSVGMFSLVFCNKPHKIAHGFDASHITQLVIEQTIELNPSKNITYHKMFLGDKDLITPYNSDGFHAFATNGADRVVMLTMDSFCSLYEFVPDTIKIDTEGFEYNVLMGGKNAILSYRPLMFIELHPRFCNMYGTDIAQCYNLQKEYGYSIKDINNNDVALDQLYTLKEDSLRTIWQPN